MKAMMEIMEVVVVGVDGELVEVGLAELVHKEEMEVLVLDQIVLLQEEAVELAQMDQMDLELPAEMAELEQQILLLDQV